MQFSGFDWDNGNSGKNEASHGVADDEAEEIFFGLVLYHRAGGQGSGERRYFAYGPTDSGKYLTVVFTRRGLLVRIISARRATRRERDFYEQDQPLRG